VAASRPDCCNDYASRDDARTRRKRLQPWSRRRPAALSQIKPSLFSDFFNDPADTKINAIAEWLP
jgi:hypothetical protein